MTYWTPANLRALWLQVGGLPGAARTAVAVALAESGGDDHAVSPTSDYGLWQINSIHFGATGGCGLSWNNWMYPLVNACAATYISNRGQNWAAWCTMWADPGRDCGHGYITVPQVGSAAWTEYERIGGVNWSGPPTTGAAQAPTSDEGGAQGEWGALQGWFRSTLPWHHGKVSGAWGRINDAKRRMP